VLEDRGDDDEDQADVEKAHRRASPVANWNL
jgi:hypothetical protein